MTVLSLVYLNPPSFERLSIIIFAVMIKEELIKSTVGLYINCIANKNLKWHKNNMNMYIEKTIGQEFQGHLLIFVKI